MDLSSALRFSSITYYHSGISYVKMVFKLHIHADGKQIYGAVKPISVTAWQWPTLNSV